MSGVRTLAVAMWRGFIRDKAAVFFSLGLPLMFLLLFGGVFTDSGASKSEILRVGDVSLLDELPEQARSQFDEAIEVTGSDDLDDALEQVRAGDVDGALTEEGERLVLHFSQADQVTAANVQGILGSFVSQANIAESGTAPTYTLVAEQVEDDSLESIQYVTPGLLGWAVALNATFGAALTLVVWRDSKLLRRLRLAPITTGSIVVARIGVTMVVALVQMVIFVGLAMVAFGLQLTGSWWMAVPILFCGTLAFMAIGLLAGAMCKTAEGAAGFANFFVLPMAFLSGSFIPLDASPEWVRVVSLALPLRYINEGMLDTMVRGLGPSAAVLPMAVLLAFAVVIGFVATRAFQWEKG
ncbi:MAG: ABC transporter permease [Actinomycetota bacterium]|nr:ABC transporter permease [Actinomycetota bacterium]